jgi:hypothetical protein
LKLFSADFKWMKKEARAITPWIVLS